MYEEDIHSSDDLVAFTLNAVDATEKTLLEEERLPEAFLKYWKRLLKEAAEQSWVDYLTGKRDSFLLGAEEYSDAFEEAGLEYSDSLLDQLVDEGAVEASVGEEGNIGYSTTDEQQQIFEGLLKK